LLELDLVLERYWAGAGTRATGRQAAALGKLLALPDNDLLDLVMGRIDPPDGELGELLETIRAA
jgi:succinate dehydrogenase flavin-adding protein (antitoxin of CptAB toxin-antitoxin module)